MTHTLSVGGPAMPMVLGRPALEAVRLSGVEGVNRLFEYELLLKTPDSLTFSDSLRLTSTSRRSSAGSLQAQGSTFVIDGKGFSFHTPKAHHVWAADHQTLGPQELPTELVNLPRSKHSGGGGYPMSI
jgi:hypothetical protein